MARARVPGMLLRGVALALVSAGLIVGGLIGARHGAAAQSGDTGTISLQAYTTPADAAGTEFKVSTQGHAKVGDGFAQAALTFTLTDAGGNAESVVTPADTGRITLDRPAGSYTLTDDATGGAVSFTVTAGATVFVDAVRSVAQPSATAKPTATGGQSSLPPTGAGSAAGGGRSGALAVWGLLGLAVVAFALAGRRRHA